MTSPAFPVGVYVGEPWLGTPSSESNFITATDDFTSLMGEAPAFFDAGISQTDPESDWLSDGITTAANYAGTPADQNSIPLIGLPLVSSASGSLSADQMFKNWAAGDYDSIIYGTVQAWANEGYLTQYWRPGWEMDESSQPWYVTSNPQTEADYVAAFQHIYTVLHAAAAEFGVTMQVVWNPGVDNSTGVQLANYYPGNAYVDVIGADVYDEQYPYSLYDFSTGQIDSSFAQWSANPVNLDHYWTYPADNGYVLDGSNGTSVSLGNLLAFAQANGKPFAIPETGAGGGTTSNDELDDPWFVQWLSQTLSAYTGKIDFVNIWDNGSYDFSTPGSGKPMEEAAWAQYFGVGLATLSGTVVSSASGAGATGLAGVNVTLYNAGTIQSSTTTASNGSFSFTGLIYGSYQISYAPPTGTVAELGSLAAPATGQTGTISLVAGQTLNVGTEALLTNPATIKGTVIDTTHGGAAEAGMTINIVNSTGTAIATTTTNSSGAFAFTDLAAGTYEIQYVPPATTLALSTGGIANPFTELTGAINLAAGQVDVLATEALVAAPATISGQVLYTTSAATGAARSGVTVELLNSALQVTATQTTSSSGAFQFTGLAAGSYSVTFVAPSGTILQAGGPANTSTGTTAVQAVTAGQVDTMPAETLLPTGAEIGGQMLLSASGSSPAAVANATVTLLNSSGSAVATTLTNASGNFLFTGLAAGTYSVSYPAASGQSFELGSEAGQTTGISPAITLTTGQIVALPVEQLLTSPAILNASSDIKAFANFAEAGQTITLYTSSGVLVGSAVTGTAGTVSFSGLAAGSYEIGYATPAGLTIASGPSGINTTTGLTGVITVAAGSTVTESPEYLAASSPSNLVAWLDYTNAQGVTSYVVGDTVTLLDGSGDILGSETTNSYGGVNFYSLPAGTYQLDYSSPAGEAPQAGGPANTATGLSGLISLAAGTSVGEATEIFIPSVANLTGSVTYAGAADAGVTVALLSSSGSQLATTTTNSAGAFQFTGIAAATYEVQFTAPAKTIFGSGPANASTGITAAINVTAGQTTTLAVENLLPAAATLSGTVLYSASGSGGAGLSGVTVTLLNGSGGTVTTVQTNSAGAYQFTGIAAGTYSVQYGEPANMIFGTGPANTSTGITGPITLAAGQSTVLAAETLLPAPATITGTVMSSASGSGGVGVAGVSVALLNSSGTTIATGQTSSTGGFQFSGLAAGTYSVQYTAPTGSVLELGGAANAATGLSAGVTVTAGQTLAVPTEQLLTKPATVTASATVQGTANWPEIGQTISLYTSTGGLVGSAVSNSTGQVTFSGLAAGSYELGYTAPAGLKINSGPSGLNTSTGLTSAFTVGAGATVSEGTEYVGAITPSNLLAYVQTTNGAGITSNLANATVTLLDGSGDILASETTNSYGGVNFYFLPAGTYQLEYTTPAGETPAAGGPANTTTGLTGLIAVAAGTVITEPTETFIQPVSNLAGSVTFAGGAEAGVAVALLSSSGSQIATTTTNSAGAFQFTGIATATYEVQFTAPANTSFGTGPANASTGETAAITLTAGQTTTLAAENLLPSSAIISGTVQSSASGSGAVGVAGVSVALLNSSGTIIATGQTSSTGGFQFSGLSAGTYSVQYTAPAGSVLELGGAANAATGLSAPVSVSAGQSLAVTTEQLLTKPATVTASAIVQGTANWAEIGQTISLYTSSGALIGSAVSNSAGQVTFSGLAAGSYELGYTAPAGLKINSGPSGLNTSTGLTSAFTVGAGATVSEGTEYVGAIAPSKLLAYVQTTNGAGITSNLANATVTLLDASGDILASQTTSTWGGVNFWSLPAGTYQLEYTTPAGETPAAGGPANTTTGLTGLIAVAAGTVITEPTETFIQLVSNLAGSVTFAGGAEAGVAVALLSSGGSQIATTTTNSAGAFQFTGVATATYEVQFTAPANTGFGTGPANASTGETAAITLIAGQTTTLAAENLLPTSAIITGTVQSSASGSGAVGVAGVSVALLNSSGTIIATGQTSSSGGFQFSGLSAGTYSVQYTAPAGSVLELGGAANAATGLSAPVTVSAGQSLAVPTEQLLTKPATVTASAIVQGTANWAEIGQSISLYTSGGALVGNAVTNSAGQVTFSGLAAGSYELGYTIPAGMKITSGPSGINTSTGLTSAFTVGPGGTVSEGTESLAATAPSNLITYVHTTNAAGVTTNLAGATVTLLDGSGDILASQTTSSYGGVNFYFLPAGTYQLDYSTPAGQVLSAGGPANTTTGLTGLISVAAGTTVVEPTETLQPAAVIAQAATVQTPATLASSSSLVQNDATATTNATGSFSYADLSAGSGNSFTLNGAGQSLTLGDGSYVVSGNASASTVVLGEGDQTVSLTGGADTIVVGDGNSTISALGGGNMISTGGGMNFISTDGSAGNVFYVDGSEGSAAAGTTTINGFNTAGDVLDLSSALSGAGVAADLSNLADYVTATVANGNTTLWVDPTGGAGTPAALVALNGISTSVAQLVAANDISLI